MSPILTLSKKTLTTLKPSSSNATGLVNLSAPVRGREPGRPVDLAVVSPLVRLCARHGVREGSDGEGLSQKRGNERDRVAGN